MVRRLTVEALLSSVWQYIIAGIGLVVWFTRLEGKTDRNLALVLDLEKRLEKQRNEDQQAALVSRGDMMHELQEMRADIKTLIRQGAK